MENELVELYEAAKKAADAAADVRVSSNGPEVARCVDALKQLKTVRVTYDVLVATQVGKKIRSLTKHPKEEIQAVTANLLAKWKQLIVEETVKNKQSGTTNGKSSAKPEGEKADTVKVAKVHKESTVKVEKVSNGEAMKVEKVNKSHSTKTTEVGKKEVETDRVMSDKKIRETVKVEKKQTSSMHRPSQTPNAPPKLTALVKCNDAIRDKIRELLADALSKVADEAHENIKDEVNACDPLRLAVSVESVLFEKMGRSNGPQKFKYRSIMFNIKDQKNPDFRRKILLGEVNPEMLITMTPEEMASDERQYENDKIKQKALFDCQLGGALKATTDQFKCGRCGQRKTTYHQMQTRSADEPMTTYVTCVNCNNHWKFC